MCLNNASVSQLLCNIEIFNLVSECGLNIDLPALPEGASCHIPDSCTGVNCCVDYDVIGKSFHAYILLDACGDKMTVGIEKKQFNVSLIGYNFGYEEHFYLRGVVRMV
jgi:hypothetical protein